MRRNNRRLFNQERETNKIVIISFVLLLIAILSFFITFVIYRNHLREQNNMAKTELFEMAEESKNNNKTTSEASSSIGKNVNEMKENSIYELENTIKTEKIAINTSNMNKEKVSTTNSEKEDTNTIVENENIETSTTAVEENESNQLKTEKLQDPSFKMPVEGEITNEFAKDTLIYSNTLQEWVTHMGIDIEAEKTAIVKAAAEGTVKSIKNDPRYGITVVLEHVNGFSSVYSNLLTAEFIKEGEKIEQGQTIGTVGNTAIFEIADNPHLHFEILKDNENIDPSLYLK